MKCKKIQKKLSAFMDGELDEQQQELVQTHLQDCRDCQEALEHLNRIDRVLGEVSEMAVQPFFLSRLHARLQSEVSPPRSLHLAWTYGKFLAPVAVVFGLGLGALLGVQLARNFSPGAETTAAAESIAYTDVFSEIPSGSLTESYMDLNN